MRACDRSWWSVSPDKHCVGLCSHRGQRVAGQAGAHTLYAYGRFAHILSVSCDTPFGVRVTKVNTLVEACLMRSQVGSDLLYEALKGVIVGDRGGVLAVLEVPALSLRMAPGVSIQTRRRQ